MRDFDEMLKGSFDAHAGEIDRAGGPGSGLATRTVRDVRRKRAWRAGATGVAAATAVLGVVATALAFAGDGGTEPAGHQWRIDDAYSLGPCASFIPANAAALPDGWYQGRAYVDPVARFVVAVMPDGTVTRVQPGPDGDFPFDFGDGDGARALLPPLFQESTWAFVTEKVKGMSSGEVWVDARSVSWNWTVEPVAPTIGGIGVDSMYAAFSRTLGFGGEVLAPGTIPHGAVATLVAIYSDGHEVSTSLVEDNPMPGPDSIDYTDLEAVAVRVTLADGRLWEIRADYTPENVPNLPCQPTPPSGA